MRQEYYEKSKGFQQAYSDRINAAHPNILQYFIDANTTKTKQPPL